MSNRKWRGALLYLSILAASTAAVGLRTLPEALHPVAVAAAPAATDTPEPTPLPTSVSPSPGKSGAPPTPRANAAPPTPKRTVQGETIQTRYGPVQVEVVFRGTKITDVNALLTPGGDGRSIGIASRAVPILHDEVIASQSARIDTVSGATYTSDGYAQSVQSAIDRL